MIAHREAAWLHEVTGDLCLGTHEAGAYKFNGKAFEQFRP